MSYPPVDPEQITSPEETPHPTTPQSALHVLQRGLAALPQLRAGLGLTALMGIVVALGQLTAPVVIQLALDRGGLGSADDDVQIDVVLQFAGLGLTVVIASAALGYLAKRRLIERSEAALSDLRSRCFQHVHQLSLADHNEFRTGVLITRVTSDIDALSRFVDWGLFVWVVSPAILLGTFVVMAFYSWPLALLSIVMLAPALPILQRIQKSMLRENERKRTAVGEVMAVFSETISGTATIRAYGTQRLSRRLISAASKQQYDAGIRANFFSAIVYVVGDLLGALVLGTLLIVGYLNRTPLGLESGELVALLVLATLLNSPIGELGETLGEAQQATAAFRKVLNLLDLPIDVVEPGEGVALEPGAIEVQVEGLSYAYQKGEPILRDVTLRLPAGANVAIVGETGSGKSTFAKLLCRLADPTEGTIRLNGIRLAAVDPDSRHASIRLVPQDGFLFDTTVRENVLFGRNGAVEANVDQAIELLGLESFIAGLPAGLDTQVGERGASLSVGERQLVAFLRASVADPGLLVLDEATSSVDPETDLRLTEALGRLSVGRTVVSIAHRLSTAESADIIVVFEAGKVAEMGTHSELLAKDGVYKRLFLAWSAEHNSSTSHADEIKG